MAKYNNYGIEAAKRRAKIAAERIEQAQESGPPKPIKKKAPSEPKLDLYPMQNEKILKKIDKMNKIKQHIIDWDEKSTTEHSTQMSIHFDKIKMQLLVMPPGTGKTAVVIKTLGLLQAHNQRKLKFVIAAPTNVVDGLGWHRTIKSWNDDHPDNQLDPILITSIDKFANICQNIKSFTKLLKETDLMGAYFVGDEYHKYKNPVSKRSKQLQKLEHFNKIGLSATPLTNDIIMDGMSYLIHAGYYKNKTDFMRKSGLENHKGRFGEITVYNQDGSVNTEMWPYYNTMKQQLSEIMYRPKINIADYDMPGVEKHINQLDYNEKLYEDMRSLAYANRQRMFASPIDYAMEAIDRIHRDPQRLEELMKIIKDKDVKQPLIFYHNVCVKDAIVEELEKNNITNYQIISGENNFRDVDIERDAPMLVQYQSGSEGIEMKFSNTSIFYQNQRSYAILEQARGRNVRRGMTHDINHYYLIADNEVDQEVYEISQMRDGRANETLEEIVLAVLMRNE